MFAYRSLIVVSVAVQVLAVSGCAGISRRVETPAGPHFVTNRPFNILGVIRRTATTENQGSHSGVVSFDESVNVPVGTDVILPAVQGWLVGFGHLDPDDLSMSDALGGLATTVHPGQRPLGAEYVYVAVTDINAPSGGLQTATIRHNFLMTDKNNDDSWFGVVSYHLVCLSFADGN